MAPRHRRESLHRFYIRTIRTLCIATYLRFGATHDDSKSRAKRAAAGRLTPGAGRGGAACGPATPSLARSNCLRVTQRPEPRARLAGGYARWVAALIRGRPRRWQASGDAAGKTVSNTAFGISFREVESEHAALRRVPARSFGRASAVRRCPFERPDVFRRCAVCTRSWQRRDRRRQGAIQRPSKPSSLTSNTARRWPLRASSSQSMRVTVTWSRQKF